MNYQDVHRTLEVDFEPETEVIASDSIGSDPGVADGIVQRFWAQRWAIAGGAIAVAILAVAAKYAAGPTYTAEAIVKPSLMTLEKTANNATIDAGYLVDGQIQIIQSLPLARKVARQLRGPDDGKVSLLGSLLALVGSKPAVAAPDELIEAAAVGLVRDLKITRQRPSYLIKITYSASTPQKAAQTVNAVAREYVLDLKTQTLRDRLQTAQSALVELSQKYGAKHPLILRAKDEVSTAQGALRAWEQDVPIMTETDLASTNLVVPAQSTIMPSGLRTSVVVLVGLVLGLVLSIAVVAWLERASLGAALRRMAVTSH